MRKNGGKSVKPYTLSDLLKNKNLEIVAAALLLSGQLKVERLLLSRNGGVELRCTGEFIKRGNRRVKELSDFLTKNGNMSIDEVLESLKNKLK